MAQIPLTVNELNNNYHISCLKPNSRNVQTRPILRIMIRLLANQKAFTSCNTVFSKVKDFSSHAHCKSGDISETVQDRHIGLVKTED